MNASGTPSVELIVHNCLVDNEFSYGLSCDLSCIQICAGAKIVIVNNCLLVKTVCETSNQKPVTSYVHETNRCRLVLGGGPHLGLQWQQRQSSRRHKRQASGQSRRDHHRLWTMARTITTSAMWYVAPINSFIDALQVP